MVINALFAGAGAILLLRSVYLIMVHPTTPGMPRAFITVFWAVLTVIHVRRSVVHYRKLT